MPVSTGTLFPFVLMNELVRGCLRLLSVVCLGYIRLLVKDVLYCGYCCEPLG